MRKHLSDAQLTAFLRMAKNEEHSKAVAILNNELDEGRTLADIAALYSGTAEGSLALEVVVKRKRNGVYEISCGFLGDTVGDGGSYLACFDKEGTLLSVEPKSFWIC